jgi:hypothetical protein
MQPNPQKEYLVPKNRSMRMVATNCSGELGTGTPASTSSTSTSSLSIEQIVGLISGLGIALLVVFFLVVRVNLLDRQRKAENQQVRTRPVVCLLATCQPHPT